MLYIKKIFYIIAFICSVICYGQKNFYHIHKDIPITHIILERGVVHAYQKNGILKQLVSISLTRENDSIFYLLKGYNTDTDEGYFHREKIKVNSKWFDDIVEGLNKIEPENIEDDFNIMDGITNSISFGNKNYHINLESYEQDLLNENSIWSINKQIEIDFNKHMNLNNFQLIFQLVWNKFKD